jgi:hypothetical protein
VPSSSLVNAEQEDFGSFVGQNRGVAKGEEVVFYYHFPGDQQIWLMTLYGKSEDADLTPKEKQALKRAIESKLRARQAARFAKQRKLRR